MKHKTTIADIAKALQITPATVSRALSNHPRISAATKHAVQKTAKLLNYNTNRIASSLRSGKSHLIGVIIPSAEINFFGSVVHGIESIANQYGYNVILYQSNENMEHEIKGIETLLSSRVDGILASISKNTTRYAHFKEVRARNIPIVLFDRTNDLLNISSVVVDDYKGGFLATEHLIRQGYRHIAHISGPLHINIFKNRLEGYFAALKKHRLPAENGLVYTGDVSILSGRDAVNYYFSKKNPPDAIFAVEDFTALGAIQALKEINIKIPEQVGIIGFANENFGEYITPGLSTIDQQTVLMGEESVKLLLASILKEEKSRPQKIVLDPIPIFRQSSLKNK